MNKKLIILITGLSAVLLTGCTLSLSNQGAGLSGNLQSPVRISENASLNIRQQINIKPGKTRVFIQDGIIVSQFNHYQPNCNLEVRKKDNDNWQSVKPGLYNIISVQQTLEQVVRFKPGTETKVASREPLVASIDSSPADIYLGMHFNLAGDDPNVMRLSCRGAMAAPHEAMRPSLDEIRQSLGNLMEISL